MGGLCLGKSHEKGQDRKCDPKLSWVEGMVVGSNNDESRNQYTRTAFVATSKLAFEESSFADKSNII